jgi:hypothetical protein
MSRIESVPKIYSIAKCSKFPFQQVLLSQIGLPTRELHPFHFGDEICPEISECAMLNAFSITPCTFKFVGS